MTVELILVAGLGAVAWYLLQFWLDLVRDELAYRRGKRRIQETNRYVRGISQQARRQINDASDDYLRRTSAIFNQRKTPFGILILAVAAMICSFSAFVLSLFVASSGANIVGALVLFVASLFLFLYLIRS